MRVAAADSFYHLSEGLPGDAICSGMACYVARHRDPERWNEAVSRESRVVCLGRCYEAPAAVNDVFVRPYMNVQARRSVVLERIVDAPQRAMRSYDALKLARARTPQELVGEIEASGVRGRGGAGFPTGKKWRAVLAEKSPEKYVVVNGDEGDPGAYIDRFIMEDDPHNLLEGALIAAHAVGARTVYVYVRAEYPRAFDVLSAALEELRAHGVLADVEIQLVRGRGSYLCGEETSLLNSIEKRRPEVRLRPPYPSEHGLFGKPTLVNNVETLANIPWIVRHGAQRYRELGAGESYGTKVVSLNSLFARPGLYEIEFGTSVRTIVDELGGGLREGRLCGIVIGGPLAGMLAPEQFDVPFTFEDLRKIGAEIGHGGIIAFDERTSLAQLMQHVFAFGADESCGKCTPCRLGTRRIEMLMRAPAHTAQERGEIISIVDALANTSLCAHGTGLAEFAASVLPRLDDVRP